MYLFCIFGLQNFGVTWITIIKPCVVKLLNFEYKIEHSDGGRIKLLSELITSWIRHPSIIFSIKEILVGFFWGILLITILSLYNLNKKACASCVGLGGLTKYLLFNFTFTGIPEFAILYLSVNLVFNCFDTNRSSSKSIFALHFLKVGFLMMTFNATSLPGPKQRIMGLFWEICNVLCM